MLTDALLAAVVAGSAFAQGPRDDGYRGIWYMNQPSPDRYRYKYSGGLATYPQQHAPIAWYSPEANKTFFCYGGSVRGKRELLHMVSYFDHSTGEVPRPVILLNKRTDDAHDNPVLALDGAGHVWIFSNSHGTSRPSFVHRSRRPYSIDDFERVAETNFSYMQSWSLPGRGFLFLHTLYRDGGRSLFWRASADGGGGGEPLPLARFGLGHYQVSWPCGGRAGTAFNYHPEPAGLNARTNLYYLETADMGKTWTTVDGKLVRPPLVSRDNAALVRDYQAEGLLVYLKDLQFDSAGRPVILYLTSRGYASGPEAGPRLFQTARWTGSAWEIRPVATTDHNYDYGPLYIEPGGTWRVIAPALAGPQAHGTGGDVVMWVSRDEGRSWKKVKQLTWNSRFNHTYVRRPMNAHPGFYALWADGDAFAPSDVRLYFTNQTGDHVWRLPPEMKGDRERPRVVW